jgi:hypothetical protein
MTEVNFLVKKGLTVPKGSASTPAVIFDASDPNTGLYSPGADQVAVATNGTGRLFVDSIGNIGIGTSTPASNGSTFATLSLNGSNGGAQHFMSAGNTVMQLYNDANAFFVNANTDKQVIVQTGGSERLRITSAGLVGIGTSSPDAQLDVTRSGNGQIAVLQTTAGRGFNFESQSDTQIGLVGKHSIFERWRITTSFC